MLTATLEEPVSVQGHFSSANVLQTTKDLTASSLLLVPVTLAGTTLSRSNHWSWHRPLVLNAIRNARSALVLRTRSAHPAKRVKVGVSVSLNICKTSAA